MNTFPTLSYLRECFDYNPETGVLTWRHRPITHFRTKRACSIWNSRNAGKHAGSPMPLGCLRVSVNDADYYVHRVAFALHHSLEMAQVPALVDHKDCDQANNRAANLRSATKAQNGQNRGAQRSNTSGYKGVYFHKVWKRWSAQIDNNRKRRTLGYFDTPEEAYEAYCAAAKALHGEFANTSSASVAAAIGVPDLSEVA